MNKLNFRHKIIAFLMLSAICLSGCTAQEDVPFINVEGQDDIITYTMVSVGYEDIVLTQKVDCIYVQTSAQEVSFDNTGKYVDKVYVKEGDKVKKGDVLCELSSTALEQSIQDLEYRIARNELLLSYLDEDEQLEIQRTWLTNPNNAKKMVESINSRYELTRQGYNDSLEFDRAELALKKTELKRSRVYAALDGSVYKLKEHLEGSTTRKDEVIMTIVDNNECLFAVRNADMKYLFKEGVTVPMKIPYSEAAGEYELMPINMDEWDEQLLFSVYTGPDNVEIEMGTTGTITAVVDSKEHVLALPKNLVHDADGRSFVYVVNSDNVREVKWIETGLRGDSSVEIISGLTEGEKVVKK